MAELPPAARRISSIQPGWRTARTSLRVLVVVHSVTAATRLADILPVFQDRRVQLFCAQTSDAMFPDGVEDYIRAQGFRRLTWEQATSLEFDVILTASLGDNLHDLKSPIVRLPHGNGYNKIWSRGAGEPGSREAEGHGPGVFGLCDETLKHDGRLIPAAIGLSHDEQFQRLSEGCPDAASRGFLAGDPCHDRLLASLPRRLHYRHAFRLRPGQRLITVSSTWQEESLFGLDPSLAARLLAELPYDEFRIALALHPNVWASHQRHQIRSWLFDALRAGLILLPPEEGWRAAVIASDFVLSDHGSVGIYAAALGRPVLLEQSGRPLIDPRSGLGRLMEVAPPLDPFAPIRPQLDLAERLSERTRAVAEEWVSSAPGRALHLIREEIYRIIGVPPPDTEPPLLAVAAPVIEDTHPPSLWTHVDRVNARDLLVRRVPAGVRAPSPEPPHGGVLIVPDEELDHRLSGMADVIRASRTALPADEETWSASVFEHRPGASLTVVQDRGTARIRSRDGKSAEISLDEVSHADDAELVFAVLAERIVTDGWNGIAALSPLAVRVSPERTITAAFRVRSPEPG